MQPIRSKMRMRLILSLCILLATGILAACAAIQPTASNPAASSAPIPLRIAVSHTPQSLASFQEALAKIEAAHPEWAITVEQVPQSSEIEKINTMLAAGTLPDVVSVAGLTAQRWIRQNAFLDLTDRISASDLEDFFPGPLDQFRWNDAIWAIPSTAAPEIVFYNKTMFDAAGLDYPTTEWTFEDMREAAIALTLDGEGRNAADPNFDPENIVQWGWNGGLTYFWQRHLVRPFGGDFCANDDCTEMRFTDPETIAAAEWWATFTYEDHATLYDPYGGSQTGVPGDPFIAGKAAMGFNGFFAIGQLNDAGAIDYDVTEPFLGQDGNRYTPLSTSGYAVAANSENPDAAWALVQELTTPELLRDTWGAQGHAVPARRSVAESAVNLDHPPANQAVIVSVMEYGEVFKPYTASVFEVYGKTAPLFVDMMKGIIPAAEAMAEIERIANEVLAADR